MPVRIGIFGSSFNPPHNAHFTLAETARERYQLKELIYIPTRIPPHKPIAGDWDDSVRSLMVRVASFSDTPAGIGSLLMKQPSVKKDISKFIEIYTRDYQTEHDPDVQVSDIELERAEVSYSIDTVKKILQKRTDRELFLIIGMDQAAVLDTWKDWEELHKLVTICAGNRPGYDDSMVRSKYPFIEIFHIPPSDISSSEIREKIAKNQSIRGLVPNIIVELLKVF